jgi:exodeoxyribonuclease VII small subunit
MPKSPSPRQSPPEDLSFRQAQTALELSLAQLQASDLDVEAMADLYRRAQGYADRCEALLQQVEQEVMQWDPAQPDQPPRSFEP